MNNQFNNITSGVENLKSFTVVPGLDAYATDAELEAVELYRGYPVPLLQFTSICCILFMIIGIPGNLITILALSRCKKIQNATAVFIIHLSSTDLLFCCFVLPTVSVSFWTQSWVHGKLFCHFFPLMNYIPVIISLLTVLAITINRYILICHPKVYVTLYTTRNISIMLAMMWTYSIALLLMPFFEVWGRLTLNPRTGTCTIVPDQNGRSPKEFIILSIVSFAAIIMIFCYIRILWVVRKTSSKTNIRTATRFEMHSVNVASTDVPTEIVTSATISDFSTMSTGAESTSNFTEIVLAPDYENNDSGRITIGERHRTSNKKGLPSKRDKRLHMMVIAIMLCFFFCYLPITMTKVLYKKFNSYAVASVLGYLTIYLAPCINPIIYVLLSREYRMAYKSMFWKT